MAVFLLCFAEGKNIIETETFTFVEPLVSVSYGMDNFNFHFLLFTLFGTSFYYFE